MDFATNWATNIASKARDGLAYVHKQIDKSFLPNANFPKSFSRRTKDDENDSEFYACYDMKSDGFSLSNIQSHNIIKYWLQNECMLPSLYGEEYGNNDPMYNNINRGGGGGRSRIADSDEQNVIVLPQHMTCKDITYGLVKNIFPLKGKFVFRFKKEKEKNRNRDGYDSCNGGEGGEESGGNVYKNNNDNMKDYIWLHINDDDELVPLYKGEIHIKALILPHFVDWEEVPGGIYYNCYFTAKERKRRENEEDESLAGAGDKRQEGREHDFSSSDSSCLFAEKRKVEEEQNSNSDYNNSKKDGNINTKKKSNEEKRSQNGGGEENVKNRKEKKRSETGEYFSAKNTSNTSAIFETDLLGSGSMGNMEKEGQGANFEEDKSEKTKPIEELSREDLIRKREELTSQRVKQALEQTQERREREEEKVQRKMAVSMETKEKMERWSKNADGSFKDVRTLLSTLHEVLWEGAEWEPVSLSTLMMDKSEVRKAYRRALLVIHPDKQSDLLPDDAYRADALFHGLNSAFKKSQ